MYKNFNFLKFTLFRKIMILNLPFQKSWFQDNVVQAAYKCHIVNFEFIGWLYNQLLNSNINTWRIST